MRRSLLVLATIAAVAGGLLSATGAAAATGESKFLSQECEKKVTALATSTAKNQVTCLDKNPSPTTDAVPCVPWNWYWNRLEACSVEEWVLTTYLIPSGAVIGQLAFSVKQNVRTSQFSKDWAHDVEFNYISAWGVGTQARLFASQTCVGSCGPIAGSINGPTMSPFIPLRGFGVVRGSVFAPGEVVVAASYWRFWFVTPGGSPEVPPGVSPVVNTVLTPTIRCDIATPGTSSPGCVYPSFPPPLFINAGSYPSYYKHIRDTQSWGVTNLLTRMTDSFQVENNRSRACPGMFPRPAGFQCDEYPFASTFEGAFTGGYAGGQTLPGCQVSWLPLRASAAGYSACMIPEIENRNGGIDLQVFYLNNRVINGDRFYVLPI